MSWYYIHYTAFSDNIKTVGASGLGNTIQPKDVSRLPIIR